MKVPNKNHFRLAAALVAGIAIGSFAVAGSGVGARALATTTGHYTVAASGFAPDGLHDTSEDYFNAWDPAVLSNTDNGRCFNAAAVLPNGAVIESMTVYYTAGSVSMYVQLNRQEISDRDYTNLVAVDTATGSTYTHKTVAVAAADATVDTSTYAYGIGVCPSGDTTFSAVSIKYKTTS